MKTETHVKLGSVRHLGTIRSAVGRLSADAIRVAEDIARQPEPPMHEFKSAARLEQFLRGQGLRVSCPWQGLPTAFRAVAGAGRPHVALLAEYDAVPDCGLRSGQWGHGCGHNLIGTAACLGGAAASEVLQKRRIPGTVLVLGTPAEEIISGKVFMAAQGAFTGLDAVLAWHPGARTQVAIAGGAAMDSILFRFHGRTAHAATVPHEGRSAADAAVLTEVAVNFLREHIEENARIHSVITEAGTAPNVVPDEAEVWYYIRGRDRKQVDELRPRVVRCARSAAMATETRCRITVTDSLTERIPNHTLGRLLDTVLRRCGGPRFTPADVRAARRISKGRKYSSSVERPSMEAGKASNDAENVSWFVPVGKFSVACVPEGTIGHTRQYAAMVRTSGAHRGMLKAAEVLAAAAVELALNRPLLAEIKAEFRRNRRGKQYDLPMSLSLAALAKRAAAIGRLAQRPGRT